MKYIILLLVTLAATSIQAQDADLDRTIIELFNSTNKRDPLGNFEEVPSSTPGSFGALDKCGQGGQRGTHICVPYYECDGNTKMLIQDGSTNGIGQIDIRFGENACDHYLDVCCGIPKGVSVPVSVTPTQPSVIPSQPPVTPVNPPVTPVRPPVTPVSPPVTGPVNPPVTPKVPTPGSVSCGIRNPNGIDFKITGNKANEAEYGEFPWMVALLWKNFNPSKDKTLLFCGGSLIAPNVVLTGAHCVAGVEPGRFKVRAGEWDTQTEKERLPYQERDVAQVIVHEHFRAETVYNNVALLILSSPFDRAENIGTTCLPNQDEVIDSKNCFASGWGKNVFGKEGQYQVILKKIELPIIQHGPCQQALRATRLGPKFELHRTFVCAGGELGKDTCTGDGGSPLVCPDPNNRGRYVQSGVVSWGIGCGEENIPGVYANVASFRTWIDQQLARLNINTNSYIV